MSASQDSQSVYVNPSVEGSRYTESANIENHPQISDFIPRRVRAYVKLISVSLCLIAGLAFLHSRVDTISNSMGREQFSAIHLDSPGSLGAWFSGLLLLTSSLVCWLIYSLRRHRVCDYRARYRGWLYLSLFSSVLSVSLVTGLHRALAEAMVHWTGWSALPQHAVWWVGPGVLVGGWIAFLIARDFAETRPSLIFGAASLLAYAVSAAVGFQWLSIVGEAHAVLFSSVVGMLGHLMFLTATMAYARFIVLDVQGLIAHAPMEKSVPSERSGSQSASSSRAAKVSSSNDWEDAAEWSEEGDEEDAKMRYGKERKSSPLAGKVWVDGSEPIADEEYEYDREGRKPSKAELKRLRKQKEQTRRAA